MSVIYVWAERFHPQQSLALINYDLYSMSHSFFIPSSFPCSEFWQTFERPWLKELSLYRSRKYVKGQWGRPWPSICHHRVMSVPPLPLSTFVGHPSTLLHFIWFHFLLRIHIWVDIYSKRRKSLRLFQPFIQKRETSSEFREPSIHPTMYILSSARTVLSTYWTYYERRKKYNLIML